MNSKLRLLGLLAVALACATAGAADREISLGMKVDTVGVSGKEETVAVPKTLTIKNQTRGVYELSGKMTFSLVNTSGRVLAKAELQGFTKPVGIPAGGAHEDTREVTFKVKLDPKQEYSLVARVDGVKVTRKFTPKQLIGVDEGKYVRD